MAVAGCDEDPGDDQLTGGEFGWPRGSRLDTAYSGDRQAVDQAVAGWMQDKYPRGSSLFQWNSLVLIGRRAPCTEQKRRRRPPSGHCSSFLLQRSDCGGLIMRHPLGAGEKVLVVFRVIARGVDQFTGERADCVKRSPVA